MCVCVCVKHVILGLGMLDSQIVFCIVSDFLCDELDNKCFHPMDIVFWLVSLS